MAYVEGRLRRLGVLRALEAKGFQPGDELQIAGVAAGAGLRGAEVGASSPPVWWAHPWL